jgi:hypothetical protein
MTEFVSKKVITQQPEQQGRGELSVVQSSESPFVNTTSLDSYFTCFFDLWQWLVKTALYYTGRLHELYTSLCDFEQDFIVYTKTSKNYRLWIILSLVALLLLLLYILVKRLRNSDKKNTINSHSYSVYDSEYTLK